MTASSIKILFTGYAPVHFVCFKPLYDRLRRTSDVEVFVAGGLREKTESGYVFHAQDMYRPLGVPSSSILSMEAMREQEFDLLFAANTKILAPEKPCRKVQIFHGVSFRNRAIRPENLGADHFFMAGPYMARKFVEAGLLAAGDPRALPIGFMKTDRLVDGSLDRSKLLEELGFDGDRPVLLYAPTGQKHCSLETIGMDVLRQLKTANRFDILVKLHDHPHGSSEDWPARMAELEDPHFKLAHSFDVTPLLYVSDLLITDASSVSSEYALLDRPMVFLDVPKLLAKAASKENSMMDEDTWGRRAGVIVSDVGEAVQAVERCLEEPAAHSEIRRMMAKDLFYNPGRATQAALDWISQSFTRLAVT